MEGYNEGPSSPENKDGEGKEKKTAAAEKIGSSLDRAFDPKWGAAEKMADQSWFEKLTGEKTKSERAVEPSSEKPIAPELKPYIPEASSAPTVEIPLGDVREEAEAYIDLRQEAVAKEVASVPVETPAATEVAADNALLGTMEQQLDEAAADEPFEQVVDAAYHETLQTLQPAPIEQTSNESDTAPFPPTAPLEAASPLWRQQQEQLARKQDDRAIPERRPAATPPAPVVAETAQPKRETTDEPAWFYRTALGRRFFPSSWPPRRESILDKVSDETRARDHMREQSRAEKAEAATQTAAIERYIDKREADIREAVRERQPEPTAAETVAVAPVAKPEVAPALPTTKTPERFIPAAHSETVVHTEKASEPVEQVLHMNHQELLQAAEKVEINGTTLREIYEARSINEAGLRRVVVEYLRGNEVKPALDRELLLKEMNYERDPQIRDHFAGLELDGATSTGSTFASNNTTPSDSLDVTNKGSVMPAAYTRPLASKARASSQQQMLTRVWVVIIVVLVLIAVVLLFR